MPRVTPSLVREVIEQSFSFIRIGEPDIPMQLGVDVVRKLAGLIDLVEEMPRELITLDGVSYAQYLRSLAAIRNAVASPRQPGGSPEWFRKPPNPVTVLHGLLGQCPEEAPSIETDDLIFITDQDLRLALRLDISATNSAFANGEWKAATVLAGSVVEALLLWKLKALYAQGAAALKSAVANVKTQRKSLPASMDQWDLAAFIDVAEGAKCISNDTATASRLAKDFRNLIHPGRSERLGQKCSRATALTALAAVEHVIRDLDG